MTNLNTVLLRLLYCLLKTYDNELKQELILRGKKYSDVILI